MPQTGSIAVAGAAAAAGAGTGGRRRGGVPGLRPLLDELGQDRERDLAGGAGAQLQPGRGEDPRALRRVDVEGLQHRGAPRPAGHQRDIRALRRAGPPRARLPRLCRARPRSAPHRRPAARADSPSVSSTARPTPEPRVSRACATGVVPTTRTRGAGMRGWRKISMAPPLRHGLETSTAPSSALRDGSPGTTRSSRGSCGRQDLQAVLPHRGLDAVPADEALDLAAGQHQGRIPGVGAGGMLGADHRGVHERLTAGGEVVRPGREGICQSASCQIGGLARPCMAAQTRAGVQGMSMWTTP